MNAENYRKTNYNHPFIEQRADPYILHAPDGSFYFTASVPAYDKIVLRHSATLVQQKSIRSGQSMNQGS